MYEIHDFTLANDVAKEESSVASLEMHFARGWQSATIWSFHRADRMKSIRAQIFFLGILKAVEEGKLYSTG